MGKRLHPLHAVRVAEIAAVTVSPDQDPQTVQGRKDEQMYREKLGAAMDSANVAALVFPVWTFPPKLNGDRGQTPQGPLTFVGSATQWPVVVVPMGFVGENLPLGLQILWPAWTEGELIKFAYAYEQSLTSPPAAADRAAARRPALILLLNGEVGTVGPQGGVTRHCATDRYLPDFPRDIHRRRPPPGMTRAERPSGTLLQRQCIADGGGIGIGWWLEVLREVPR